VAIHKEISFQDEICDNLAANGWLHADGDSALYGRAGARFRKCHPRTKSTRRFRNEGTTVNDDSMTA
jgi:hypothetical protein